MKKIFSMNRFEGWNLSLPLIQGGMGVGVSLSGLAGAVASEGGMGVISTAQIGFEEPDFVGNEEACNLRSIRKHIVRAKELASGKGMIAVNVMVALQQYREHVKEAVRAGADAVICGAGLPVDLPELVEAGKAKIAPIVSSRRAAALLLALLLVLTMAGCGSEKTLTLTAAMPEVPATLDPAMVTTDTEKTVVLHLYENLMKLSSGGSRAVAGQASSYEKTDNGDGTETYTFRLRSSLTWSDGTPLTAADFVYAWQRLADPATGSPNASLLRMVAGYDRVRAGEGAENLAVSAPDERTFVVTLSGHCPYFAESVCVAPETMPARADAVQSVLPVTNGAYEVSSWEDGQLTAVQRRAYYDSRRLGAQSLTFLFETDADARQQLFEDGKADFLLGLTEQAVERRSDSWSAEPGFRVAALLVNQLAEATGEEPLRQALSLSIDRNALTDAIGARTHLSAQGLVPTGVRNTAGEEFRTVTDPVIDNLPEHREQNLRQAAKLLEGVADGGAIELLYEQTDENETVMHQLQQTWQDGLSLTVTLRGVSADELQQSLQRGEFTVAAVTLRGEYNDPTAFLETWTGGAEGNWGNFYSSAYDTLLRVVHASGDDTARDAYLEDAEALLLEKGYVIPLYEYTRTWQLRDHLAGLAADHMGGYWLGGIQRVN